MLISFEIRKCVLVPFFTPSAEALPVTPHRIRLKGEIIPNDMKPEDELRLIEDQVTFDDLEAVLRPNSN